VLVVAAMFVIMAVRRYRAMAAAAVAVVAIRELRPHLELLQLAQCLLLQSAELAQALLMLLDIMVAQALPVTS
jgi:hypothetical protein